MVVPKLLEYAVGHSVNPLYTFPIILALSLVGCLLGTWLSEPEDEAILKEFYRTVRPWGIWGPIRRKVEQEHPGFQPNRDCKRDWANVFVGIIWQLCLTALPVYVVLRNWAWVGTIMGVLAVTTIFIKFNWYDKLEKTRDITDPLQRNPVEMANSERG
jgi:hypothetical protein